MKQLKWASVVVLVSGVLAGMAQVPASIHYQGRLVNGTNLVNGPVALSLRLYDTATLGSLLYEDSNTVVVADGLYSTMIGDNTVGGSLTNALESPALYVETVVNGVVLSPRERVVSVAYALRTQTARGVVAGGITASMLATGSVTSTALAPNAVGAGNILDGEIDELDVAVNTFWQTGGNAGTSPAGHYLGTTDGSALRLQAGGGVGIGTANPQAELHVADGDAGTAVPSSASVLVLERASSAYMTILAPSNSESGLLFGDGDDSIEGAIIFNSANATNGLQLRTSNNNTRVTITQGGDVGIGTFTPEAPLHIVDGSAGTVVANGNAALVLERNASSYLNLLAPDALQSGVLFGNPGLGNSAASIVYNNALAQDSLMFAAGGNGRLIVDEQGNIGVNVFDPSEALHVAGSNVRVETTNGVSIHNPGNTGAFARLDWLDNMARLRIGGTGDGVGNGFDIQRAGNRSLLRVLDSGNIGIGTTNPVRDLEVFGGQSIVRITSTNEENTAILELKTTDPTPTLWGQVRFMDANDNVDGRFVFDDNNGPFNSDRGIAVEISGNRVAEFRSGQNWFEEAESETFDNSFFTPAFTASRGNNDGEVVFFVRGAFVVGSITAYSNGVTYNGFSGAHLGWTTHVLSPGSVVRMTGDNRQPAGEIQYGIEESSVANDPAVLGAYLSPKPDPHHADVHLVSAVGNGDMLVADVGGDIEPGDALISSDVRGCARKDSVEEFPVGHVIARSAERVIWADVPIDADGIRRKRISVLFDPFTRHRDAAERLSVLEQENTRLREELDAIKQKIGL